MTNDNRLRATMATKRQRDDDSTKRSKEDKTTEHKEGDNQLCASRPLLGLLRPLECTRRLPHHFRCRRHVLHLLPCQRQQTNNTRRIKHNHKHKRQQPTQKHFLSGRKKANNSITYHGWLHWCRHSSRRLPRLRRHVLSSHAGLLLCVASRGATLTLKWLLMPLPSPSPSLEGRRCYKSVLCCGVCCVWCVVRKTVADCKKAVRISTSWLRELMYCPSGGGIFPTWRLHSDSNPAPGGTVKKPTGDVLQEFSVSRGWALRAHS